MFPSYHGSTPLKAYNRENLPSRTLNLNTTLQTQKKLSVCLSFCSDVVFAININETCGVYITQSVYIYIYALGYIHVAFILTQARIFHGSGCANVHTHTHTHTHTFTLRKKCFFFPLYPSRRLRLNGYLLHVYIILVTDYGV